jgi:hypothetical protein
MKLQSRLPALFFLTGIMLVRTVRVQTAAKGMKNLRILAMAYAIYGSCGSRFAAREF